MSEESAGRRRPEPDPDGPDTDPHVVLLGDFDAAPGAASVRFWTGRQSLAGTSVPHPPGTWSERDRYTNRGL
jgi:hypothetical protein